MPCLLWHIKSSVEIQRKMNAKSSRAKTYCTWDSVRLGGEATWARVGRSNIARYSTGSYNLSAILKLIQPLKKKWPRESEWAPLTFHRWAEQITIIRVLGAWCYSCSRWTQWTANLNQISFYCYVTNEHLHFYLIRLDERLCSSPFPSKDEHCARKVKILTWYC